MNNEKSLHFSLGKSFGALLAQISQEHITCEYDWKKAWDVFAESGAPVEYALDLMTGKKIITVDDNGIDCYVVDRSSVTGEFLKEHGYPKVMDFQDWIQRHIIDRLEVGYNLMSNLKDMFANIDCVAVVADGLLFKELFNVPEHLTKFNWRGTCTLTGKDILEIWNSKDRDMLELLREDDSRSLRIINNRISAVFNDLDFIRNFTHEETRFLDCAEWLVQQFGTNSAFNRNLNKFKQLVADAAAILTLAREVDGEGIAKTLRPYMEATEKALELGKSTVEHYLSESTRIQRELDQIRPVDISKNYDAGFISPEGKVYALMGDTSQLLHIQLADALWELYGWPEPDGRRGYSCKDFVLMEKGWVKFHHGWVLYDGYNLGLFQDKDVPLTRAQIEELERYADAQPDKTLKCGYEQIRVAAEDWPGQEEYFYRRLFEI